MNKKEISEIKKQFKKDDRIIDKICGCYVDAEKNIVFKTKQAFHSVPEEEAFKYYDIFKHSLSGTLGKNLINMDFPLDSEAQGGTQEFLMKLRESKLDDDDLIDIFYNKIINSFDYPENYYLTLINCVYDIPGKTTDGIDMFDASDEVYNFILFSISPVNLTKAGLGYNYEKNVIEERIRDWVVDLPIRGFLFPSFNDRSTDIHSVLYYTKKPEDLSTLLIENVLGSYIPLTAKVQKDAFNEILATTLGNECDYDVVMNIHENLNDMIAQNADEPEPLELTKNEVKKLLSNSGVKEPMLETFEKEFVEIAGDDAKLVATNIASPKKFNIETPDVVIKVNPDRADLIETRIIEGRQCLVIEVSDHIEVNGVTVYNNSSMNTDDVIEQ